LNTENVVIFGTQEMAEMANWYLTNDSCYKVKGFCLDGSYIKESSLAGKPVVAWEEVSKHFPSDEYSFFAPLYAKGMNKDRMRISQRIKDHGYRLISYAHNTANLSNCNLGDNCFIFEYVNIQPFSKIGSNVIIWSQSHIGHHGVVEDNNFLSGHVVIGGKCLIKSFCFIGTNSSLRESLVIEEGSFIGMGSCVVKNTEAWSVYMGVPAKKKPDMNSMSISL
jgi:sugar O-acyltransferase (sialic acid O-acetyltransferase NeuD family)